MDSYEAAKARIFANQHADDVAIGFVDDATVQARLAAAPGRQVTFGRDAADYRLEDGWLTGPRGPIAAVASMRRSLPHDITNALAASALVLETGLADEAAIATALAAFVGPPHRLEHIGTWDDIAWFNDSKATTPHAAAAAIRGFDRIVLIAGGYDKGVDLSTMAVDSDRVSAVVAVGATAPAIVAAFADVDVVEQAAGHRRRGGTRPAPRGCRRHRPALSGLREFDQYSGFEARGDHFRELVLDVHRRPRTRPPRRGHLMTSTLTPGRTIARPTRSRIVAAPRSSASTARRHPPERVA